MACARMWVRSCSSTRCAVRAQRKLPERGQIAGREIMVERALGLLGNVDLAFLEPLDQLLGRQVDHLDIVGLVEHQIRHRLAHADARDLRHDVVQAFDMLDVERGVHVDAGREQFLHVEIALRMPGTWRVGMGQLVHQRDLRTALQERVQVHLVQDMAVILDPRAGEHLEPLEQRLGFRPAVGFDNADNDIGALAELGPGRQQHLVGFADARRRAQKYLQLAPRLILARASTSSASGEGRLIVSVSGMPLSLQVELTQD